MAKSLRYYILMCNRKHTWMIGLLDKHKENVSKHLFFSADDKHGDSGSDNLFAWGFKMKCKIDLICDGIRRRVAYVKV